MREARARKVLPCVIKSELILNTVDCFIKAINGLFQAFFHSILSAVVTPRPERGI